MAKCRKPCKNCRQKPHNMAASPARPPRGSIRKAKRDEMRKQKKINMSALATKETHQLSVEPGCGEAIS
jgi:hypothetical protein